MGRPRQEVCQEYLEGQVSQSDCPAHMGSESEYHKQNVPSMQVWSLAFRHAKLLGRHGDFITGFLGQRPLEAWPQTPTA